MPIIVLVCMFLLGAITGVLGFILWQNSPKRRSKKMTDGYFKFNKLYKPNQNTFIVYPKNLGRNKTSGRGIK